MKTPYRIIGACVTWASIFVQYLILLKSGSIGGFASTTISYLSYFTILTNILVGLALTTPFLRLGSKLRNFFEKQAVRAAIALYITVVMVVYWALLARIHSPVGLSAVANIGLHLIVPLLYISDWLLFAPKDKMSFTHIPYWVIYPLIYGIYTIIRGGLTGVYPYPFMNVAELGMGAVSVNMLGFTAFYAIGSAGFIGLGRRLGTNSAIANDLK